MIQRTTAVEETDNQMSYKKHQIMDNWKIETIDLMQLMSECFISGYFPCHEWQKNGCAFFIK